MANKKSFKNKFSAGALTLCVFALATIAACDTSGDGVSNSVGYSSHSASYVVSGYSSASAGGVTSGSVSAHNSVSHGASVSISGDASVSHSASADISVHNPASASDSQSVSASDYEDISQSAEQSVSQSAVDSVSQSSYQSAVDSVSQSSYQSVADSVSQSFDQSAEHSAEQGGTASDGTNDSSTQVNENQVYSVQAYVDGELYTTFYASQASEYTVTPQNPTDITTDGTRDYYFYGWFTDENFTHKFCPDFKFTEDAAIYGMTVAVNGDAFEYVTSKKNVTITGLKDSSVKYVGVPARINGKTVESISYSAFENSSLKFVFVAEGVKSVSSGAFRNCAELEEVVLPDSLEKISYYCFGGCSSLKTVKTGDNVRTISGYAFGGCENLSEIVIGRNVERIDENAFEGCAALSAVYYAGNSDRFERVRVTERGNEYFHTTPVYYYSETAPSGAGNYWHYDEYGFVKVWND